MYSQRIKLDTHLVSNVPKEVFQFNYALNGILLKWV